ncbi:MAG: MotA/TolQ/ExbB proton channel family protein [Verrucomicrobia bacterium]|nr:MotA/TolQ/ExbB proton channel family protein [Verrucomicrobiota bacterium]
MNWITKFMFMVSEGLLIPVVLFLVAAFGASLWLAGGFYGAYMNRLALKRRLKMFLTQAAEQGVTALAAPAFDGPDRFFQALRSMRRHDWRPAHVEKCLADFETACRKEVEFPKMLMRVGPMLGLMVTLIPMGPALTAMASGDIASMAYNLQVAFSGTVVGLFVAIIGFVVHLIKHRWAAEDLNHLEHFWDLIKEGKK